VANKNKHVKTKYMFVIGQGARGCWGSR